MSKKLLLLMVFGLVLSAVFAASIAGVQAGLNTDNPDQQRAKPGDTITVTYAFTPSGFDEWFGAVQGSRLTVGAYDRIRIQWYSASNGTGNTSYTDVDASQFPDPSVINDEVNQKSLTFVLPTAPPNRQSFRIRSALYGDDGEFNEVVSAPVISTGIGTGTYAYIMMDMNTSPTVTVQINNPTFTKIGQTLHGSYTYQDAESDPEGESILTWKRTTGTDPNGTYMDIPGANGMSYIICSEDLNRFIKFQVTPVATTGVLQGTATLSAPSSQVMPASTIALDAAVHVLHESPVNDGSITGYLIVNLSNGDFQPTVSNVTIANLPPGLSVGNIVRATNTQLRVYLSGAALHHEHASSILNDFTLLVTVPASQIVGQNVDLQTPTGFSIDFANNPVANPARNSVGNGKITLSWNTPAGLAEPSALLNFKIYRNNTYINQINYSPSQSAFSYTDTGLTNGSSYQYYILADYNNPGVVEDPLSINIAATPMALTSFSFAALGVSGTIDQDAKTVQLVVPMGTNLSSLVASFSVSPTISVRVNGTLQTSGVSANNFSTNLQYILSSADGSNSTYTVTASVQGALLDTPELTEGNPTTSSIQILWTPVSGAVAYSLDISTDSLFGSFLSGYQSLELTGSPGMFVINGLAANTVYYARMRALSPNPGSHSSFSGTLEAQTQATGNGSGSTEMNGNSPTIINIGQYYDATWDYTINPALTIAPQSFNPQGNNIVEASLSFGSSPEGLRYLLEFDNPSIGIGTFTMSYDGLPYDPTDLGFRLNGGGLVSLGAAGINTTNKTITISIDALSKSTKGIYNLELIANDATGQTLPVMLSSFSAIVITGSQVRINWTTQTESGVQGFYVLRGTSNDLSAAETISPLIEATNTSGTISYAYTDSEIPGLGEYYYWLQIQDITGSTTYTNSILVKIETDEEPIPEVIKYTTLKNAYPNPFNPIINFSYEIVAAGHVSMEVYNARGQKIRTLVSEAKEPAAYIVTWDGKDANGREVSSGPYLVKMKAKGYETTRKITLLK